MKLHHIGFIVNSIDSWEKNMIYEKKIKKIFDPLQNAKMALYKNYSNSYIELIEPINSKAFTWNSLIKNKNHFHHLCYEVGSYDILTSFVSSYKLITILKPIPSLLFDNKYVCFFYSRNRQIIEFLINNYENKNSF